MQYYLGSIIWGVGVSFILQAFACLCYSNEYASGASTIYCVDNIYPYIYRLVLNSDEIKDLFNTYLFKQTLSGYREV